MKSYGKLCTQYYDLDKPQPPADALAFYIEQANLTGGLILEPMCGSGRFLIPLMQRGFDVTGVDASPEMLDACRRRALKLGLTPDLHQQFLHELDVPGTYNLVMIPSGSFGLITELSEVRESLSRIYDHLAPGGRFVLEMDQLLEEPDPHSKPGETTIKRADGAEIKLTSSGSFDPEEFIYRGINRYELIVGGHVIAQEFEQFDLRYYDPHDFKSLLEASGFFLIEVYAAFDPQIPVTEAESLVFTATRS